MKRLFVILNRTKGNALVHAEMSDGTTVTYYESKQEAKKIRDELNRDLGTHYFVSRGPDNLKSAKPHSRPVSGLRKYQRGHHRYA